MRQSILKSVQFGLIASALLAPTAALSAGSGYSEYVSSINFSRTGGIQYDIILENASNNKHINAVNIQPVSNHFDVMFDGAAKCQKDKKVDYYESKLYLGNVSLFVDIINEQGARELGSYNPTFRQWTGTKWVSETGNFEPFTFNLSEVKNLSPNLRIDPVGEFNKMLAAHVNSGKSKLSFLQKEQFIDITRPVTLASACSKYINPGYVPRKWGYKTVNVTFNIRYKGDPEITNKAQVKAGLLGGSQGKITQNLPMQLSEAKFQPNMPHHIGKCAPDEDPVLRVNYKGNGKGKIQFMIEDNGSPVFSPNEINYDSTQQINRHFDFKYPLIAKLAHKANWRQINVTFNHPLTVRAKIKDHNSDTWGQWENYGAAVWRHRCTPQLNIPAPGNGQKVFDQTPTKPSLGTIKKSLNPTQRPARKIDN